MPNGEDQDLDLKNEGEDTTQDGEGEGNNDTSANDDDAGDNGNEGDSSAGDTNIDDVTDPDELREMLKKQKEQNTKLYSRIQESKGLKLDKKTGKWIPKQKPQQQKQTQSDKPAKKSEDLTQDEMFILIEAKVPRQDLSIVKDYARMNKVGIEEALQAPLVKGLLEERAEERETANATNVGPSRGGQQKPSRNDLLRNAESKGEIPDEQSDVEEIVEARLKKRMNG